MALAHSRAPWATHWNIIFDIVFLVKQMEVRFQWLAFRKKSPSNGFLCLMLIKATVTCWWTANKSQTYTLCILHPGVFAVLLLNANPNDSPYYCLTGSNTACFVTLLCILEERKWSGFIVFAWNPAASVYGGRKIDNNKGLSISNAYNPFLLLYFCSFLYWETKAQKYIWKKRKKKSIQLGHCGTDKPIK